MSINSKYTVEERHIVDKIRRIIAKQKRHHRMYQLLDIKRINLIHKLKGKYNKFSQEGGTF